MVTITTEIIISVTLHTVWFIDYSLSIYRLNLTKTVSW